MTDLHSQTPESRELHRKVKRIFNGRVHKHDKFEVVLEADAKGTKTAVVPYEPTVDKIERLVTAASLAAQKGLLERLLQSNGAYIGLDGRRVDDMVHHDVIKAELAALERQQPGKEQPND